MRIRFSRVLDLACIGLTTFTMAAAVLLVLGYTTLSHAVGGYILLMLLSAVTDTVRQIETASAAKKNLRDLESLANKIRRINDIADANAKGAKENADLH